MDFDPLLPEIVADPYPDFAARRRDAPVQWSGPLGTYVTFGHAEADAALRHRGLGRLWRPRWPVDGLPAYTLLHVHSMLENEPPTHTRLRRLVAAAFGRRQVELLRDRIGAVARGLARDVRDAGADGSTVDLMPLYAEPLPVAVIAGLLGVPDADRGLLRPWSAAIVRLYEPAPTAAVRQAAETAAAEYVAYVRDLVAHHRAHPGADLLSSLIAERDADGTRLSEDELVATAVLLQMAGHEASVNVVGNGTLALLRHPAQLAALTPELVPTAVEELIRYDSPLQLFERTATVPVRIGGVTVEPGQKIAALLGAANRDPAVFADPDRLDVTRSPNPHLGFGAGIHFCLGAPLARVELQASLATLLTDLPGLALAGEPERRPSFVHRALATLPVTVR
ncbi:MAG: Putative cytochrome P450 hydroxylase [uncultured Corynebacteriales bacterium]|uniref:Cytochrome P450 hydroxylase n=1 Tax=uncultured Mycobacteriales bacterium TaxID=581187 RepID=A0A6J4JZM1_9ACTN|nr:MAG: Putative cytochrome P450 hydroxylase [uncultured Corynebacteriales bacterium]